jgi:hypothetical protein
MCVFFFNNTNYMSSQTPKKAVYTHKNEASFYFILNQRQSFKLK